MIDQPYLHNNREEFQKRSQRLLHELQKNNYRIPPGYKQWKELASSITQEVATIGIFNVNFISTYVAYRLALWIVKEAPIYCLTHELIESLIETKIDNLEAILPDLPIVLPTFLVLFPKQSLKTPDNNFLEYMLIHASKRSNPEYSMGYSKKYPDIKIQYLEHKSDLLIDSCSIDSGGYEWFAGINLESDGSISYEEGENLGSATMVQDDQIFIDTIRVIFIQILLLITYEPDLLSDCVEKDIPTKGQGFSPLKKSEIINRYPRWIGKHFQRSIEQHNSSGKTHQSPRTHWRKGHFKKVAIGKNRSERKVIWIRPVLVNKE